MATPILAYQPIGGVPIVLPPGELPPSFGITGANVTQLVNGQSYLEVVFDTPQPDTEWIFTELSVVNTDDPSPLNIWPGIVTARSAMGFTLQLNGMPDTDHYYLHWAISGLVLPPGPATTYSLSGPSSGGIGIAKTFTVHLPISGTVTAPVHITPSDGAGGGAFTPTSVTLTTDVPEATFTYTPASYGSKTISTTNDGFLLDPASISFTCVAVTYTLSGPSTGATGSPSSPFTVALPVGGVVLATVTVTPSDGGGGGTFTPTTVSLTTGAPSATFTYTSASAGAKTISVTNNKGLTNPGNLTYTAVTPGASDTFTDTNGVELPSHTMDQGPGWTRFQGGGTNQMTIQSNKAQSFTDISNGYAYITDSGISNGTISIHAYFGVTDASHYCHLFFRYVDASNFWMLRVNGTGSANVELVKHVSGSDTVVGTTALLITAGVEVDMAVVLSGSSITSHAITSGQPDATSSTSDSFNQSATKHGMGTYVGFGAASQIDEFHAA